MTLYILCFILFLVGIYGVLTRRNLIKVVISLTIMEFSVFLMFVLVGYVSEGLAPLVTNPEGGNIHVVDPLPQALVLTAAVIAVATNSMMLALAIRLYKKNGTFDIRKINELKG